MYDRRVLADLLLSYSAPTMGNGGSILPWDNWIYHVDSKKHEVNTLHASAVALQDSINSKALHYNALLDQVKQLLSGNAALVIIIKCLQFNDVQLKDFDAKLKLLPDPPKGSVPAKFGSFLAEVTGSILVLKAVVNVGKLLKNAAFEVGEGGGEAIGEVGLEGLAETGVELGVEAGVEAGVGGALAETGVGIIAAVGLDVIFGAINGAKEAHELDDQIGKLNAAVEKLRSADTDLNDKLSKLQGVAVDEEKRFHGIVNDLQKVIPYKNADSWLQLATDLAALPLFLAAQTQALRYYGLLSQLRVVYIGAKERSPKADKETIISVVLFRAKAEVTHEELEKLWDILARYSTGMQGLSTIVDGAKCC